MKNVKTPEQKAQNYKETSGGSEKLKADIVAQKQKITDLESKIESGKGNEAVAQKLRDTQENLKTLQEQYDTDKQSWTTKEEGFQNKIKNIHVDSVFAKAQSGLKFKASYPESVQKTLIKSAKEEILRGAKPDWIESEGDRVLVFRNENGDILRNKSKGLNPYTANELLAEKLKDSIEVGGKPGAGTKPPSGKPDEVSLVDLSSAKTQVAADEIITSYLLQQGEIRGSSSFSEKQAEIRTKNEISKLPLISLTIKLLTPKLFKLIILILLIIY